MSTIALRKACEPSKVPPPPDMERASLINTGGAGSLDTTQSKAASNRVLRMCDKTVGSVT